jgi:hypothetical protein
MDPTRPVSPPVFIVEATRLALHLYLILRQAL